MFISKNIYKLFCCVFILLILFSGCFPKKNVNLRDTKPFLSTDLPSGNGWWYVRFSMNWPHDTKPVWHMDLFLAHQIISPLLKKYKEEILLWRFHRRAARDASGRQFSFIFYTTPINAVKIFSEIESDPLLTVFKPNIIEQVSFDNTDKIIRPDIKDTSDHNWPLSIQKTWPYYIMGVSEMWLNLINCMVVENKGKKEIKSVEEINMFYKKISDRIDEIWIKEGRHAFIHHLNALFGYKPVIYWEKRYLKF